MFPDRYRHVSIDGLLWIIIVTLAYRFCIESSRLDASNVRNGHVYLIPSLIFLPETSVSSLAIEHQNEVTAWVRGRDLVDFLIVPGDTVNLQ